MITTTHSHKHWTDEGGHVNSSLSRGVLSRSLTTTIAMGNWWENDCRFKASAR